MSKIMKATELLQMAALAVTSETLYVKGGWGQLATSKNKAKAISRYAYNKEHKAQIEGASYRTWFFDCVCFIKALAWGWRCLYGDSNGGATYESNGVEDMTCKELLTSCGKNVFDINNKKYLVAGAILYMNNHVGIYAGDNKVIECAPSLCGVKVTQLTYQRWTKYGLLPWIDYEGKEPLPDPAPAKIKKGTKIYCNKTPLYVSYDAKKPANHLTGYYYISDGIKFGTRYRVCKDRIYCGAINKVLGYVDEKEFVVCGNQ